MTMTDITHVRPYTISMGTLSIGPCPSGDDTVMRAVLARLTGNGIDTVVSLLTDADIVMLGLQEEKNICESMGIAFLRLPIPDQGIPVDMVVARAFVTDLVKRYAEGRRLYIHCMHGIGRAPTIAAAILVMMGMDVDMAYEKIAAARGGIQVTPEQRDWVRGMK